jgi:hypothetical protein
MVLLITKVVHLVDLSCWIRLREYYVTHRWIAESGFRWPRSENKVSCD